MIDFFFTMNYKVQQFYELKQIFLLISITVGLTEESTNGFCIDRKTYNIFCCKGWMTLGYTVGYIPICEPICLGGCINGKCTSPNKCACNEGYKESLIHNQCDPVCPKGCDNGQCVLPNTCECLKGYEHETSDKCVPVCDSCKNGTCIAPGICKCLEGYFFDGNGLCSPICPGCINGNCVAPGVCTCNTGYQNPPGKPGNCEPFCDKNCGTSGTCIGPYTCECNKGFQYVSGTCVAKCDPECINGVCTSPGECKCVNGFKKIGNACVPHCDTPCINGNCVFPNKCECKEGYHLLNQHLCGPICPQGCTNGNCVEPGKCSCFEGYTHDPEDKSICHDLDKCNLKNNQLCKNGIFKDRTCECLLGFERIDIDKCYYKSQESIQEVISAPLDQDKCITGLHKLNLKGSNILTKSLPYLIYKVLTVERKSSEVYLSCTYENNTLFCSINCDNLKAFNPNQTTTKNGFNNDETMPTASIPELNTKETTHATQEFETKLHNLKISVDWLNTVCQFLLISDEEVRFPAEMCLCSKGLRSVCPNDKVILKPCDCSDSLRSTDYNYISYMVPILATLLIVTLLVGNILWITMATRRKRTNNLDSSSKGIELNSSQEMTSRNNNVKA